jgi:hypothetical protein
MGETRCFVRAMKYDRIAKLLPSGLRESGFCAEQTGTKCRHPKVKEKSEMTQPRRHEFEDGESTPEEIMEILEGIDQTQARKEQEDLNKEFGDDEKQEEPAA